MTAEELLDEVKTRLCITGDFHDAMLNGLISDVKEYLTSAGADAESSKAVGCIARGVADLWNMGSGDGKFSEIFRERVIQLTLEGEENVQTSATV